MKELLLSSFLAGDELDIIKEQDVDTAKGLPKSVHLLAANAVDEFIDELFGRHVGDLKGWRDFGEPVSNSVQEVCFAEPGAPVEIQRVVRLSGLFRDRLGRSGRKLVRGTNDKSIEGEARIVWVGGDAG